MVRPPPSSTLTAPLFPVTPLFRSAWPGVACPGPRAEGPDGAAPLFALGYGLSYAKPGEVAQLPVDAAESCGEVTALPIFTLTDAPTFALPVATADAATALGSHLNEIGRRSCRERGCTYD